MTMFGRVKTARMTVEVINQMTGEVLKVESTPEDLPIVMRTYNTLNSDNQFKVNRIYAYGEVQDLKRVHKTSMEWRPVEEV